MVKNMQVNPIQTQKPMPTKDSNVRASIFYINDMHAQYSKMPEIKSEADTFELTKRSNPDVDSFVLAGGDSFIGKTKAKNKMVSPFLNATGVEYSAMGNHDVDQITTLEELLTQTNTIFLAANLNRTGATPFDKYIDDKKIASSTVVESQLTAGNVQDSGCFTCGAIHTACEGFTRPHQSIDRRPQCLSHGRSASQATETGKRSTRPFGGLKTFLNGLARTHPIHRGQTLSRATSSLTNFLPSKAHTLPKQTFRFRTDHPIFWDGENRVQLPRRTTSNRRS